MVSLVAMVACALITYNVLAAYSAGISPAQWAADVWRPLMMTAVASAAADDAMPPNNDARSVTSGPMVPRRYVVAAGRSPIPQDGENIARPLGARRLAVKPSGKSGPAPSQPVHWRHAGHHIGQEITVYGKIVDTYPTGSVCILNFAEHWQRMFRVVLTKDALTAWPDAPETYFSDKSVHIQGKVVLYDGRPQIRVTEAEQVLSVR